MNQKGNSVWLKTRKALKIFLLAIGGFAFFLLIISFTRIPYDVQRWLGTHKSEYKFYPDEILFLGGSGMPSESNLIRLYYVSRLSKKYPQARIMIVHPKDDAVIRDMREELNLRGVNSDRIDIVKEGTNTHDQSVNVAATFPHLLNKHILLVTSAESMLRTVQTYRRTGFGSVGGQAAHEVPMYADLRYDFKKSGGKRYSPDVSENLALRYNFWNYLKIEIACIREFTAIGYYWVNGWI